MIIREIQAKNILTKSKIYPWTINPYVGCQHACSYCYARFMKRFSGHQENWGDFVDAKINAPELLAKEILKKKKDEVWLSGVCDCYQPLEAKYKLTRQCLKILLENDWPIVIQTKSPLVLRDLDLLKKFHKAEVGFSIPTGDEEIRKIFEPQAPPISGRIAALGELKNAGIKTFAMVAPLLPALPAQAGAEILPAALKNKVDYVLIDRLNYHYADWVYKKHQIREAISGRDLAELFKKQNIPCRVLF